MAPAIVGGGIERVGDMEGEMDEKSGDKDKDGEGISDRRGSKSSVVGSEQVVTSRAEEEELVDEEMKSADEEMKSAEGEAE